MGTWGTAIFSDDLAADVRDAYRDYLGDGLSGPQATERLMAENVDSLKDPDEAAVFWFALAATQWKHGRLEERVKSRALQAIASGNDVRRWENENPKEAKKRVAALEKLRLQLELPQPSAKRVPKRFVATCNWANGQVIAYRLTTGRFALLLVVKLATDRGGTRPICGLLDFVGYEIPNEALIRELPLKNQISKGTPHPLLDRPPHVFRIGCLSQREFPHERVTPLLTIVAAPEKIWSSTLCTWRYLDELLKRDFGLE